MSIKSAGYQWLKEHYNLVNYNLTHCSYIGNKNSIELTSKGNIEQVYGPRYAPRESTPLFHLEFGLKYDDLSLDFLKAVFSQIGKTQIGTHISKTPSGINSRKIGFLYEFLTGDTLPFKGIITKKYIDLLDNEKYFTSFPTKNSKWRVNNNLTGTEKFCPVIRKTKSFTDLLKTDVKGKIDELERNYPEEIFKRATNFLYNKETRSSYEIEREKPSPDRMEKFVRILMRAGSEPNDTMLTKERLTLLQNNIVDQRFAASDFRDFQNYIGESLPNYTEIIHYICPPPSMMISLMEGLKEAAIKTIGLDPEIRAALIAFGFLFIHPYEDGNGRLHRFLIHDVLAYDGIVPAGLIIPVSAHMLNHIKDYDAVLEKYSKPLMQRIKYSKESNGELIVTNANEVEGYFRYPDLTNQCIYLAEIIRATLEEDMPNELTFLQRFDEAKKSLQNIVDMPDKDISMMLIFLHQNNGVFPKRRRDHFSKLTDQEIEQMQKSYREIYELDTA